MNLKRSPMSYWEVREFRLHRHAPSILLEDIPGPHSRKDQDRDICEGDEHPNSQ